MSPLQEFPFQDLVHLFQILMMMRYSDSFDTTRNDSSTKGSTLSFSGTSWTSFSFPSSEDSDEYSFSAMGVTAVSRSISGSPSDSDSE